MHATACVLVWDRDRDTRCLCVSVEAERTRAAKQGTSVNRVSWSVNVSNNSIFG